MHPEYVPRDDHPFLKANTETVNDTTWVQLCDGATPAWARTAIIGELINRNSWTTWDGITEGDVTLDILMRLDTHEVRRQVLLPRYGSIELAIAPYNSLTVWARDPSNVSTSLPPQPTSRMFSVSFSAEYANPSRDNRALWVWKATTDTINQTIAVPYGARRVWGTLNDAGFVWRLLGGTENVAVPSAMTALVPKDVLGTQFTVTDAAQVLIWEIEL